jgi:predicted permease
MFSNSTSMQLIYVDALSDILANMIHSTSTNAKSKGYVIVLIYTIFVNFIRWSVGYNIMKPDESINLSIDEELANSKNNSPEKIKAADVKMNEENISIKTSDNNPLNFYLKESRVIKDNKAFKKTSLVNLLKEGINMPFVTGVAAIVISSLPYVGAYFKDTNSVGYKLLVGNKIHLKF